METALSKPRVAVVFMESLKKLNTIFYTALLQSGFSKTHAQILSERLLCVYQGELLLGRISGDISYLENDRKNLIEMYREYRTFYKI